MAIIFVISVFFTKPKWYTISCMTFIQTLLQTIWASVVSLGIIKVIIAVVIIALLSRAQKLLGFIAALIFIAYLAHWI